MLPSRRKDREKLSFSNISAEDHPVRYVTELQPNDVLMGRGAPIINYEGNVRFRDLVRTRKADYIHTTRHQVKDEIARSVLQEIHRRDGHFLRRIDSETELRQFGITEATKAWMVVHNDVALEKVKQALRDKDSEKRNDDDSLLESNLRYPASDFTDDSRSFSAPYLSTNNDWVGGQRSHFHELLKSQSLPSNLAFHTSLPSRSNQDLMAGGIPALGQILQQNQSFAASLPPVLSFGTGFRTSDYLREFLRRKQALVSYPSFATSQIGGDANSHTGSSRFHDRVISFRDDAINDNLQLSQSHGSFESTGRLPYQLLPPIPHGMNGIHSHLGTSANAPISMLNSLLEEQEILLQRPVHFGTTTSPLHFSSDTVAAHLSSSRNHDAGVTSLFSFSRSSVGESTASNTAARMPATSSREKVETSRMEAKSNMQSSSSQTISVDRKRKASETKSLTSLISAENAERGKAFVDNERNKKRM